MLPVYGYGCSSEHRHGLSIDSVPRRLSDKPDKPGKPDSRALMKYGFSATPSLYDMNRYAGNDEAGFSGHRVPASLFEKGSITIPFAIKGL